MDEETTDVEMMTMCETHLISKSSPFYEEMDDLCFRSKNLYNASLYATRQKFFNSKEFQNYYENDKIFNSDEQKDYKALPAKVAQQVLKQVDLGFKSFFKASKSPKMKGKHIKIPHYKDKLNGRNMVVYTKQAISKKSLNDGIIHPSQTNIFIKTKQKNIVEFRIVPHSNGYQAIVIYKVPCKPKVESDSFAGIDPGVNNLVTVGFNNAKGFRVNGRPLKAINQHYNKRVAHYKSKLKGGKKTSKRIKAITNKRNNRVKDYLHKASKAVVNQLVSNNVSVVAIGHNKEWKQDTNMSKVNNQNFVQIPHSKLFQMISYKARLQGITVVEHEESYTSKCSFMDNETIGKHEVYLGKRIKRGLFRTAQGRLINADLNGALNILKKVIGEFQYSIQVCSTPLDLSIK